ERGYLPSPGLHRPGAFDAGDARRARRLSDRGPRSHRGEREGAAARLRSSGSGARAPDDRQRGAGGAMTDDRMALLVGGRVRTGVMIAAAVTVAGGFWYLATAGGAPTTYRVFRGEPAELRSVGGVIQGIRDRHPEALIQLGLLLLVATPVARVALSAFAFA